MRFPVNDKSYYEAGIRSQLPGGAEYADDYLCTFLQGSTQCDALGHMWVDELLWNGYPAVSTVGRLRRASVDALGARGIVGRGVLLDIPLVFGTNQLTAGQAFGHEVLEQCARLEGVEIRQGDVLLVRTGWSVEFHRENPDVVSGSLQEPGLCYSSGLVDWFSRNEIASLVTDTFGNEVTTDPETGATGTLHIALMRNLGVIFTEMAALDALARDCRLDGQYEMLFVGAPLRVVGGSGAPINPVVIK
jgi:kynurenine formamidase